MTRPVRALVFGLGPIGQGIARLALERAPSTSSGPSIEVVAAVDAAPDKAGKPLADVLGVPAPSIPVVADAEAALRDALPQVVLHATGSYLPDTIDQLLACVRAGASVVSTCEELSYPWRRHPELAKRLDAEARDAGVTVLGTGVNPGFVMDTLPALLSTVCQRVERVRLARLVDVSQRREQLQRKVGVGLTVDEFHERAAAGRFGHVGLKESCWLLAEALGWRLDSLDETLDPVPGESGRALGQLQRATGKVGDRTVIEATVQMSTDIDRPRDEIEIEGVPPVHLVIEGGVQGDLATAAMVLNVLPRVLACSPGLATMLDLPLPSGPGS
jgi:4-hydroxy-tetrahydrodipicolinate reductase